MGAKAAAILQSKGFVIVNGTLTDNEAEDLHAMCLNLEADVRKVDPWRVGNRGPGRYCMHNVQSHGNCWNYHEIFAQSLADNDHVLRILNEVMGPRAEDWQYCTAGGDFVLGSTHFFSGSAFRLW